MASFSIENFGCRATDADASAIRRSLLASGLEHVADHVEADVVVLNTCTVTAAADSQAREAIRKIHRANPNARILVTGCYAQRAPQEIAILDGVSHVVGNSHLTEVPVAIRELRQTAGSSGDFVPFSELTAGDMSLARGPAKILTGDIFTQTTVPFIPTAAPTLGFDRTRPILKIQDGCNNRCSYCVIPFVRGKSRSLPPGEVVAEVATFVSAGAKEIVLSGINLGSYGRDLSPRVELVEVVRRILEETCLEQIRFSSIEPQDITEDFVALVASSDRIAQHFHVPLQSGSDRILRAMHRWYRAGHYAERIKLVHQNLPYAAIGADVIVGFPGETREDFDATCDLIASLPLTYLHVFSFSGRPGTQAVDHCDHVPPAEIRERARFLRKLGEKKSSEFRESQAGRSVRALTLARNGDNWTEALTGNYLKVRIEGSHPANEWHDVTIRPGS